jgi:hypothetical protein
MIKALWQLASITKIKSHKSLKKILITTTLNTPKLRVRLWWHPQAGTKMDGMRFLMGVCWWWIGLGKEVSF